MTQATDNASLGATDDLLTQSRLGRRTFMQAAAGTLGAVCGSWGPAAQAAGGHGKAKSVILIFNCGAPSHIDLWDPKPEAPDAVRSSFATIDTVVPGIQVTELIPEIAKRMDRISLVRSVHHRHGGHNSGMHWSVVGRPYRIDSTLITPSPTDYPCFGTLTGWLAQRDGYSGAVPPYVITPSPHCDSFVYLTPGQYGGCLGVKYDPFVLNADPAAADFKVRNLSMAEGLDVGRLTDRRNLLGQLDARGRGPTHAAAREIDDRMAQAAQIVESGQAARAFDLSLEPAAVRDRYGRGSWGQSHLLARRLIEAGSKFVTTVNGPSITWDTHQDNFGRLKNRLVPPMEQAYTALLDDLAERGLLDSTLVVMMGDFGRTPLINKDAGRDHWPNCYTMLLAGGGIRGGQV
ncbi:MAG TPA: DUF1501 domain-containing protein, partial [Pirellulaceae bacterium]|nr:DUF1501 domain-containing protein [Pirellulaceae bacterium]